MIINGIEIYSISNPAYEQFVTNALNYKNIPRDVLELRLTTIALNTQDRNLVLKDKYLYRFGDFTMIINEFTKKIEVIGWRKDDHHSQGVDGVSAKKLRDTFKSFGLNNKGTGFKQKQFIVGN